MPVIDASVWASRFLSGDVHHEQCRKWFTEAIEKQLTLYSPAIVLPEVASAIARQGEGKVLENLAAEAIAVLQASGAKLVDVSLIMAARAASISLAHRVRGCDAIYIALAEHLGEPLVTLDNQQRERGAAVVKTIQPFAE